MFIAVNLIWSVITSANIMKTILLLLEPPDQIKFCLQLFFFEIKFFSISSNISES